MDLYIFGNGCLSFTAFLRNYWSAIQKLNSAHFHVCDFRGADVLTIEALKCWTSNVTVYHVGKRPRYQPDTYLTQVNQWTFRGGFLSDQARDTAAIEACTHFLAIDITSTLKRRSGTQRNIEECLRLGKIDLLNELKEARRPRHVPQDRPTTE